MSLETSTELLMWATAVMALFTLLAVIAALFGDVIKALLFKPDLRLELRSAHGEKTQVKIKTEEHPQGMKIPARYYHLTVSNGSRVTSATQTQVFLVRVETPGPDGQMQIKWDSEIPLSWAHQQINPLMRTIGPAARLDLFNVIRGDRLAIEPVIMPFSLQPYASYLPSQKCHIVLSVEARSAEGNSPVTRFELIWDGEWHDGEREMSQHLIVRRLDPEPIRPS